MYYAKQSTGKTPKKIFYWFGIKEQLQSRFFSDGLGALIEQISTQNFKDASPPVMESIHTSPGYKEAYLNMEEDKRQRCLFGMLSTDGFNPFGMKTKYSMWPLMIRILNHHPTAIAKFLSMFLIGIVSGPTAPITMAGYNMYLMLLVDELTECWIDGMTVMLPTGSFTFFLRLLLQLVEITLPVRS